MQCAKFLKIVIPNTCIILNICHSEYVSFRKSSFCLHNLHHSKGEEIDHLWQSYFQVSENILADMDASGNQFACPLDRSLCKYQLDIRNDNCSEWHVNNRENDLLSRYPLLFGTSIWQKILNRINWKRAWAFGERPVCRWSTSVGGYTGIGRNSVKKGREKRKKNDINFLVYFFFFWVLQYI